MGVHVCGCERGRDRKRDSVYVCGNFKRMCSRVLGFFMCCAVVHTCMTLSVVIYDCTLNLCPFLSV